jgi:hypothetical protein
VRRRGRGRGPGLKGGRACPDRSGVLTPRHVLTAVLVAVTAIALLGATADPDLWGHVRFGQDILSAGGLPLADTYSFTSDRPWINHEWLAEVAMALAFEGLGATGLNLLRLTIVALTLALVWWQLSGVEHLLRLQLVALAGLGILLRVHPVRPQLFSVLLFAVTLWLIRRADERQSIAPIVAMPLVLAAWVNLHGGWIVGIGALGYWIASVVVARRAHPGHVAGLMALGIGACLATLLNPYGTEMWRFLAGTVRVERPMIADWQPISSLPPAFAALWLVPVAVTVLAMLRARGRMDWARLGLVTLLGLAAFRVSRLDAFFALAAVMLLGPLLARAPAADAPASSSAAGGPRWRLGLAAVSLAVLGAGAWLLPRISIPDGSPEPEAARYVKEHRLEGNMLTWFDWGEYAIWHFSPAIRVSIDGRRETTYTSEVTAAHLRFYAGTTGTVDYPDRIGADYIWLPRDLPVVPALRSRGWLAAFEGPVSVLLTRSDRLPQGKAVASQRHRSFPEM